MIKILDEQGKPFFLGRKICRDAIFYATEEDVQEVIQTTIDVGESWRSDLQLYRRTAKKIVAAGWNPTPVIHIRFLGQNLVLGCHSFDSKTTQTILKWAGVKKAKG